MAMIPSDDSGVVVVLVDDQPMIGEAIRRALAGEPDIVFHYCSNGSAAVAAAEKIGPTVILQDLVMPDVDGLTLVRQYRANPATQNVPVIVLSSKEDAAIKSEAFAADVDDYLVKLPDKVELIARIRHHSKGYLHRLQRDAAYQALSESQRQLVEMNLVLQRLGNADGLTGLNNRRYLDERISEEWKRAIRRQNCLSLLMIDVDDFKKYNDSYGHLAGDEVLKQVAEVILASLTRPTDLAARFGGEEFVVMLPDTPLAGAGQVGEKLCRKLEALQIPHSAASTGSWLTLSVGAASICPQASDVSADLLDEADRALYAAKRAGKNRIVTSEHAATATADATP
jgi:two-component system chemotaxis family response regulator WspR